MGVVRADIYLSYHSVGELEARTVVLDSDDQDCEENLSQGMNQVSFHDDRGERDVIGISDNSGRQGKLLLFFYSYNIV